MHNLSKSMSKTPQVRLKKIAITCERELVWFSNVLDQSLCDYFKSESNTTFDTTPPNLENDPSEYADLVNKYSMSFNERLI